MDTYIVDNWDALTKETKRLVAEKYLDYTAAARKARLEINDWKTDHKYYESKNLA